MAQKDAFAYRATAETMASPLVDPPGGREGGKVPEIKYAERKAPTKRKDAPAHLDAIRGDQAGGVATVRPDGARAPAENALSLNFPHVCPEPVLVN
jgi:hypothetical protein